jgi:hypothetical protein
VRGSAAPVIASGATRIEFAEPDTHGVAERFELPDRVLGKAGLRRHHVGQPLIVHARRAHRLGDVLVKIDRIEDHLQHDGDDAAAAGRSGDQPRFAVLEHDRRAHGRERPLARARQIGFAADEPECVRHAGLCGKIVELVVEQDAGALRHDAEPIIEIERVGVGNRVAEAVDHGEMRRVVAFVRSRGFGPQRAGRRGMRGIDGLAQRVRMGFRDQALDRNADLIGIAEKVRAVRIGALHRFDH